ncbi:MAG: hypothetical protein ACOYN5_10960 [Bacteroidales bacterium]|jgi:hypothetical protein
MIVKLKGELETELKALGLKAGDEVGGFMCPVSKVGAFQFDQHKYGSTYHCVVWPDNYEIIDQKPLNKK